MKENNQNLEVVAKSRMLWLWLVLTCSVYFKGSYIMPIGPKYCNYVWGAVEGGFVLTHTGEVVVGVGFAHAHVPLILLSSCNFSLGC